MTAPAKFSKADMKRLFSGARESGYMSVEARILPDGSIIVRASDDAAKPPADWRDEQPLYRG